MVNVKGVEKNSYHHWDVIDEDGCLHCNCGIGVRLSSPLSQPLPQCEARFYGPKFLSQAAIANGLKNQCELSQGHTIKHRLTTTIYWE